jgi:hypothetical protein
VLSKDFSVLTISFKRPVKTSTLQSCESIFAAATVAKFGLAPICTWKGTDQTLSVIMGAHATLASDTIEFLEANMFVTVGDCTANQQFLRKDVVLEIPTLVPTAIITAPETYAPSCSTLTISGKNSKGFMGRTRLYSWTITGASADLSRYQEFKQEHGEIIIQKGTLVGR